MHFQQYGHFSLRHISFVLRGINYFLIWKIPEDLLKIPLFLPSEILGPPVALPSWADSFVPCWRQLWGCTFQDAKRFSNQKQEDLVRVVGTHISVRGETDNPSLSPQAFMYVLKDLASASGSKLSFPGPLPQISQMCGRWLSILPVTGLQAGKAARFLLFFLESFLFYVKGFLLVGYKWSCCINLHCDFYSERDKTKQHLALLPGFDSPEYPGRNTADWLREPWPKTRRSGHAFRFVLGQSSSKLWLNPGFMYKLPSLPVVSGARKGWNGRT